MIAKQTVELDAHEGAPGPAARRAARGPRRRPARDRQLRHPRGRLRRGRRVIVLGIDPGTAALGYGIVERTRRPRCARSTTAASNTSPDLSLPERLLAIHALRRRADRAPRAGPRRRRAAVLLAQRPDGVRGRPGARRRAAGRGPARTCRSARRPRTRSRARSRATARPTRSRSSGWSSWSSG